MSRRARKRARAAQAGAAGQAPPAEVRRASRSELRNAEARAKLEPLRHGERPTAVTVAAAVAALLVIANAVLAAVGYKIQGHKPSIPGVAAFTLTFI